MRLLFGLSLVATMLLGALPVGAAAPDEGQTQENIIHVVQPGQNLFRIALYYGATVDAILAANGLTDAHTIYAGQRLLIPQNSNPVVTTTGAYVVQRGDTLSRIARQYGIGVEALMRANGLSNAHVIYAGQQLLIPGAGETASAPLQAASDTYVVRQGDTLSGIARQFSSTSSALARLNGIVNPSAIYPGQVLRLSGATPAVPAATGRRIVINLSEQHLYAFEGEQLVYSFVASSGAAPNYTRSGEFRVQSKLLNAYGSAWDIWMPHWLQDFLIKNRRTMADRFKPTSQVNNVRGKLSIILDKRLEWSKKSSWFIYYTTPV